MSAREELEAWVWSVVRHEPGNDVTGNLSRRLDTLVAEAKAERSREICTAIYHRAMKDIASGPGDVARQIYQGALMDAHRIAENPTNA